MFKRRKVWLSVAVLVPYGDYKPYQDREKYFWVKKGADKRRVTERTELRRLFRGGRVTYADASPVRGTTLADLDIGAMRSFYEKLNPSERLSEDDAELTRQLQGIRLMVGDELGVAAVMLFAGGPSVGLP